jgi:hypothetical protein
MRRIITLTAIALGLSSGVALADRHRGGNGGNLGDRSGGVVVRDHRGGSFAPNRGSWNHRGSVNRSYDRGYTRPAVTVARRPVFATNGRFYFGGNNYRTYQRPVIDVRYRNYDQRPALIVEHADPMPGYLWIAGQWQWNGYEWIWTDGHYDVDPAYNQGYDSDHCDSGTYNSGSYDNSY